MISIYALCLGVTCWVFFLLGNKFKRINILSHLRLLLISLFVLLFIFLIITNSPFVPNLSLDQGQTCLAAYIRMVVHSFVDGLLPGIPDTLVVDSFWRRLGWQDILLPVFLMDLLRYTLGAV